MSVSEEDRARVAERLRQIREAVRDRPLSEVAAPAAPPRPDSAASSDGALDAKAETAAPLTRPDGQAVNASWNLGETPIPGGVAGLITRGLRFVLQPWIEAQAAFNSRQVQLDNAFLEYIDARSENTHRHYDEILGIHGRHMEEIDERHLILQEELVAHVHDLVRRIDLVLAESEKGKLSLEFALRDVRTRLARIEKRLAGE